jgi:hypothetical protein
VLSSNGTVTVDVVPPVRAFPSLPCSEDNSLSACAVADVVPHRHAVIFVSPFTRPRTRPSSQSASVRLRVHSPWSSVPHQLQEQDTYVEAPAVLNSDRDSYHNVIGMASWNCPCPCACPVPVPLLHLSQHRSYSLAYRVRDRCLPPQRAASRTIDDRVADVRHSSEDKVRTSFILLVNAN